MKKILVITGLMMAAIVALTGCQKETARDTVAGKQIKISASFLDTKTTNDNLSTLWAEGDALAAFYASGNDYVALDKAVITDGAGTKKAEFTLQSDVVALPESADWYVLYPYYELKNNNDEVYNKLNTPAASESTDGWMYIGNKSGITQDGFNNMANLAGFRMPMYGKFTGSASELSVSMKQLAAGIEFYITNGTQSDITVNSVSFTAPEPVVGCFKVNVVGEAPAFTKHSDNSVSNQPVVNLTDATLAPGAFGKVYVAVKPFTQPQGQLFNVVVNCTVGGKEGVVELALAPEGNQCVFSAGKIKRVNLNITAVEVEPDPTFIFNTDEGIAALGIDKPAANAGTSLDGKTITDPASGNSISFVKGEAGTAPRVYLTQDETSLDLRIYNKSTFTVIPPSGYYITKLLFTGGDVSKMTTEVGTLDKGKWTGKETVVPFNATGTLRISTIAVVLEGGAPVENNTLSVAPATVNFDAAESSTTVAVESNKEDWTVDASETANWLTVEKDGATVKVSAKANTGSARSTTFVVKHATDVEVFATVTVNQSGAPTGSGDGTEANPYDVVGALYYTSNLEAGAESPNDVFIVGKICSIKYSFSNDFGTATFDISNDGSAEGSKFTCYGVYYLENRAWAYGDQQIQVGDDVVICGKVINYNGTTPETQNKKAYIKKLNGETSIAKVDVFDVPNKELTVGATATSATINVIGNVAWTATSEDATVDPASGEGVGSITVSFAANADANAVKTYTVVVSTTAEVENKTIDVVITQAKAAGGNKTEIFVDFTQVIDVLPQGSTKGVTDGTYTLSGFEFTFHAQTKVYQTNSNASAYYLIIGKKDSYILLPAIQGKALQSVKFKTGEGASEKVIIDLADADGKALGVNTKANSKDTEYTYPVNGSTGVQYKILITNAYNAQFQNLTLTYQ